MAQRPEHRGRVTPKRQRGAPAANGPHPPLGQVGRRPSNPAFLLLLGLIWIACGITALVAMTASWRLIPGLVFIGIGGFFVRGAATAVVRRSPPGD